MEGFIPLLAIAVIGFFIYQFSHRDKSPDKQQSKQSKSPPIPKTTNSGAKLRNIFFDVEVKRIDRKIGGRLKKSDSVRLEQEGARSEYPGAISVYTEKNKWLGYIEKEVANDIRESLLSDDLHCHVHNIWVGDRGGFGVYLNLRGTQSSYEQWLEYVISCRKPKKSSQPNLVDGHHVSAFSADLKLLKFQKKWVELEKLLIKLSNAARHEKNGVPPYYIEELGKLQYKLKHYSKAISCFEETVEIYELSNRASNRAVPKPVLNLLKKAKEKVGTAE